MMMETDGNCLPVVLIGDDGMRTDSSADKHQALKLVKEIYSQLMLHFDKSVNPLFK